MNIYRYRACLISTFFSVIPRGRILCYIRVTLIRTRSPRVRLPIVKRPLGSSRASDRRENNFSIFHLHLNPQFLVDSGQLLKKYRNFTFSRPKIKLHDEKIRCRKPFSAFCNDSFCVLERGWQKGGIKKCVGLCVANNNSRD